MYTDIMIDIETLGTEPGSIITSIAAVPFNRNGEMGKAFYMNIDIQSSIDAGLTINAETLKFWMEQRHETFNKMLRNTLPVKSVLNEFHLWLDQYTAFFWGNSASFDVGLIKTAAKKLALDFNTVLPYRGERCYRTLMSEFGRYIVWAIKDELKAYDPIYDCMYQIEHLCKLFKYLNK
jgi:DNA polymerase III epsilon subunit-like protein